MRPMAYPGQPQHDGAPYTSGSVPVVPGRPEEPFTLASLTAPRTGGMPPVSLPPSSSRPPIAAPAVRRRRVRPLVAIAAALASAVLVVGAGVGYLGWQRVSHKAANPTPTYSSLFGDQAQSKPGTISVFGTLTLTSGFANLDGQRCAGRGGFDDVHEGAQVVLTDASGTTLAVGALLPGLIQSDGCVFAFAIQNVPSGKGFYGVTVSHRGTLQYSEDRLKQGALAFTLGD
jgi:hypothetical protein